MDYYHQAGDGYVVTGRLVTGQRFRPIRTDNQRHALGINLFNGSVWLVRDGKRILVRRVVN